MTPQEHIELYRDMAKSIREAMDVPKDVSDPQVIAERLELLRSVLGTSAEIAAKAEYFYNEERKALYDLGEAKKSDSTGFIDAHISDAVYWKSYTDNLQRNLKVSIDALRSELSYLKSERDNMTTS